MKKALIAILILILVLTGIFLFRGGHHAIYLADILDEWLDADDADQTLSIQVQMPGFQTDDTTGQIQQTNRQLSLTADSFWTEYADRPLFGLTFQGMSAWTDGRNLYMDTGRAYALPDLSGLRDTARRIGFGFLLRGRITKDGNTYHISMDHDELNLQADLVADRTLLSAEVTVLLSDGTSVSVSMMTLPAVSHPIPREITEAIVQSRMEPPMSLSEPLDVLLPALQDLLPLEGALTLGVECGILDLQETVDFSMDSRSAQLIRKGAAVSIDLPDALAGADPSMLALLVLRNGSFIREDGTARFTLDLSADTTAELCAALVPQAADLGIAFTESNAELIISDGKITSLSLTANGEVPFLITTIPVSFQAALNISK